MKYRTGNIGRVITARFDEGDDVLGGIAEIADNEGIDAAVVYLVGGLRGGRFVVGPKKDEMPPEPLWKELTEPNETLAIGTLFRDDENVPRVHLHGAYGKGDDVSVGCLRTDAQAFLVLEAVILEIKGIDARRLPDAASGLKLLSL